MDDKYLELKEYLEVLYLKYNRPDFIENDPISIPHLYSKKQDIEITAFWTAILSWGQRITVINKCKELFGLMDNAPHDFLLNHEEKDLKRFLSFKHRTFNATDTLYFISFLSWFYKQHQSLEYAVCKCGKKCVDDIYTYVYLRMLMNLEAGR